MPRATVSMEPITEVLKSAPPDGFVKLRRMSYGQLLASQDLAYRFKTEGGEDQKDQGLTTETHSAKVSEYRFATCIVEHNLEDDRGQPLNFQNPATLDVLDPRVGQEIDKFITSMHNFEEALPNSEKPSTPESSTNGVAPKETTSDGVAKQLTSS